MKTKSNARTRNAPSELLFAGTLLLFLSIIFAGTTLMAASPPPMTEAGLRLPAIFSDNMALQQDVAVPVWGWADPGEEVTVSIADQSVTAKTSPEGKWKLALKPLKTAENLTLTAKGKTNSVEAKNVVVGEVWIAAGQSNMGMGQGNRNLILPKTPVTDDPQLRLFIAKEQRCSEEPLDDLASAPKDKNGCWLIASKQTIPHFSAVGYYFGRDLRAATKRPVGVILSSIGGVPAQTFISRAVLSANPELRPLVEDAEKQYQAFKQKAADFDKNQPALMKQYEADLEQAKKDGKKPPEKPWRPKVEINPVWAGVAYNSHIAPIVPFAMKGVIWYQGESNDAKDYRLLFTTLINEWRSEWGQGDFPFLFVQITYHNAYFREVQQQVAHTVANTAMVVISDHAWRGDSHPIDKEPVGERLALAARAVAYGEKIECSGPVYESVKFEGPKAVLTFSHVGGGLVARDGTLKGFQLAGADKNFVVAKAEIVGDTVVVSCEQVPTPVAVRYCFLDRPIDKAKCEANGCINDNFAAAKYCPGAWLANKEGLPAPPFRTDTYPQK